MDRKLELFYPNGKLQSVGIYKDNILNGLYKEYDESGKLIKEVKMIVLLENKRRKNVCKNKKIEKKCINKRMVKNISIETSSLIYPLFICEGENIKSEIESMPEQFRYSLDRLNERIRLNY